MASVDDRIVQMQFDNTQFERRMSDTLKSLEKLNTTLATAGAKNGLEDLKGSIRGFNLGPIGSAVEGISSKFLALSTIAITALSNIVNKAVDAGLRIVNAFSFAPIMDGFAEYELNMGSIQTILANTERHGTTLDEVTASLDELNQYADKTIYNFGDMVRNIGLFTNAGIGIESATSMIQGFSNVAAASGTSAQGAASAAYQLSQALSAGTIRLQDWRSLTNVGMGNKNMQLGLIEIADAMGTLSEAGITAQEVQDNFNGSLESNWLSADVMSTYLQIMAGDMDAASMAALGLSDAQIEAFQQSQQTAEEAATKIRTFSQLMGTIKEQVGSGWSETFKIVLGDFEEATELFSGLGDAIGNFVSDSAARRNELLQGWKDLGGRDALIQGLKNAFTALSRVIEPVMEAFREIFPPMTAERLVDLTEKFRSFTGNLIPLGSTMDKIKAVALGFFNGLKIGWTVLKEGARFVIDLVKSFSGMSGVSGGGILDFLANFGETVSGLREKLVDGGGIKKFFDTITAAVKNPRDLLNSLKNAFLNLFDGFKVPKGITTFLERVGERFGSLGRLASRLGGLFDPLMDALGAVVRALGRAWDAIREWFSSLGDKLAAVLKPADFDSAVDAINVGLLGGIAALLWKFVNGGLRFDFGGGLLENITDTFEELTGVLSAMQTSIKADALLKIATALGILTASVVVLSLIDSEALTRGLTAMAVGFGQLMAAFAILNKLSLNVASAGKLAIIAGGMILMAGAVVVLTGAIVILSMLDWDELIKGLVGVGGALALLTGAAVILSKTSGGLIRIGVGMMAIAAALGIMAGAVKLFSMMAWKDIGKGLAGVAGALAAVAIGMRLMPKGIALQGAGLLLIAASLLVLKEAVESFAELEWEQMGKGLVGVAGALAAVGLASKLIGPSIIYMGPGLLVTAIALGEIFKVVESFSGMNWGEIGRGLVGLAGALAAVALGMAAANGSLMGAAALLVASFALGAFADVMREFASMSWGTIGKGLAATAAAMLTLGISAMLITPAVPGLLGFAAALLLIGGAVALFGVGIASIGKGFEMLAKFGKAAAENVGVALEVIGKSIPDFLRNLAEGILGIVQTVLEGIGPIVQALGVVVGHILDSLIELVPKGGKLIREVLKELLHIIREFVPDFVETGFAVLLGFLEGIANNIGEIANTVADIITGFLDALSERIPDVIDSVYNFLLSVFKGVAAKFVEIGSVLLPKGVELIRGLLDGATSAIPTVLSFFTELPGRIVEWLGAAGSWLLGKGVELITGLLNGAQNFFTGTFVPWLVGLPATLGGLIVDGLTALLNVGRDIIQGLRDGAGEKWDSVVGWFQETGQRIRSAVGTLLTKLLDIGRNVFQGLYDGAREKWNAIVGWFQDTGTRIRSAVGRLITTLLDIGKNVLQGLYDGARAKWAAITGWFGGIGQLIRSAIGKLRTLLNDIGYNVIAGLYNGALNTWETLRGWFTRQGQRVRSAVGSLRDVLRDIGANLLQGLYDGARDKWSRISGWFGDVASKVASPFKKAWEFVTGSPSRLFCRWGGYLMEGLQNGMSDGLTTLMRWLNYVEPTRDFEKNLNDRMANIVSSVVDSFETNADMNPVITPVLDLTVFQRDAKALTNLLPETSYLTAAEIARSSAPRRATDAINPTDPTKTTPSEVHFEQNIYAPKQLSTGEVYRQTRNQIAIAKEELSIP